MLRKKHLLMQQVEEGELHGAGGQDPQQAAPPPTSQEPVDTPPSDPTPGAEDNLSLEDAKKLIADLRKENADRRTKNKDQESRFNELNERYSKVEAGLKGLFGEEEELAPEEQVQQLQHQNEATEMRLAVLEAAQEYGVGKEAVNYFEFLIGKKAQDLDENGELTEEDIEALATEAKSRFAPASTTVGSASQAGQAPAAPDAGDPSVDDFAKMNMGEKSHLYSSNPDLYNRLVAQAKKEGKFI